MNGGKGVRYWLAYHYYRLRSYWGPSRYSQSFDTGGNVRTFRVGPYERDEWNTPLDHHITFKVVGYVPLTRKRLIFHHSFTWYVRPFALPRHEEVQARADVYERMRGSK